MRCSWSMTVLWHWQTWRSKPSCKPMPQLPWHPSRMLVLAFLPCAVLLAHVIPHQCVHAIYILMDMFPVNRLPADMASPFPGPSASTAGPSSPGPSSPPSPPLSARLRLEQELAARQQQVARLMAVVRAMGDEAAAAAQASKQLASARQETADIRARIG